LISSSHSLIGIAADGTKLQHQALDLRKYSSLPLQVS